MAKLAHIVARQVGSAYPLVEFARILAQDGYKIESFAYELALPVFTAAGLNPRRIENYAQYATWFPRPDILFTGTSEMGADDSLYWAWARSINIMSMAWVDQPINLGQRFPDPRAPQLLPHLLLANDLVTLQALVDFSPKTELLCFGSPYLAQLQAEIKRSPSSDVHFVSEPTPPQFREEHGMDHIDSFIAAYKFWQKWKQAHLSAGRLLIKLHPRDSEENFRAALKARSPNEAFELLFSDLSKNEVLKSSHMIFGMRSMMLFESSALGIATLSFQPNSKTHFPFIDEQPNVLRFTTEDVELDRVTKLLGELQKNAPFVLPMVFSMEPFLRAVETRRNLL